jgi:hypothetical protein
MSRTKQRMYLSLMGVCAVALLVDRLVLRRSATAPASADAAVGATRGEGGAGTAESRREPIPELPFPRGLSSIESAEGFRDIFSPSDNSASGEAARRRQGAGGSESAPAARDSFVAAHRLDAVMEAEGLKIAIVNGVWVRVGQSVSGCALREIRGTEARFACSDGDAVLIVAGPGTGPRG